MHRQERFQVGPQNSAQCKSKEQQHVAVKGDAAAAADTRTSPLKDNVGGNQYAELIEGRLKWLGITCDLLCPNSDVPMDKVLASISARSTLYAILVTIRNFQH